MATKRRYDMATMVFNSNGGLRAELMDGDGYSKFKGGLRLYVAVVSTVKVGIFYQPGIVPTAAKDCVISQLGPLIEARRVVLGL